MAKIRSKFVCQNCGYETGKWLGKCPECGSFSTFVEEIEKPQPKGNHPVNYNTDVTPKILSEIKPLSQERTKTGLSELDRVLGGGFVQGSLTLVGGDPGIGKSTLLLQICQKLGEQDKNILYVSGEESVQQIKIRADRLEITTEKLKLLSETNLNIIESVIAKENPDYVIIDSIQTMFIDEVSSAPGSVSQVREATSRLMHLGKGKNISLIIVGHVTKDGAIAGHKIVEHMVHTYRILRAVKNRFGGTNEIGVFEMVHSGLREILNPSEFMLSGRPENVSGSVVTCSLEGTRPMLLEVQALVSYTTFNIPRRTATGMDFNRVVLLIAVLEKRANLQLAAYDSYVNLTGCIKIAEPSLDAAVAVAIASSYKNVAVSADTVVFGEIGLTGEIRAVSMAERRVAEAAKLGFKCCIVPQANYKEASRVKNISVIGVSSVEELLSKAL